MVINQLTVCTAQVKPSENNPKAAQLWNNVWKNAQAIFYSCVNEYSVAYSGTCCLKAVFFIPSSKDSSSATEYLLFLIRVYFCFKDNILTHFNEICFTENEHQCCEVITLYFCHFYTEYENISFNCY